MDEGFVQILHQLFVPELHAWLGAIGGALLEKDDWRKRSFKTIHQLQQHEGEKKIDFACSEPLTLESVVLLRDRVKPYQLPEGRAPIPAYLGIDVGSVSTNLAVIDETGELMHDIYLRTQGRPLEQVSVGLKEIEQLLGDRIIIRGSGTTGSGRELIGELVGAPFLSGMIVGGNGRVIVARMFISVDLPAPFGPSRPSTPGPRSSVQSFSAQVSPR